MNRVLSQRRTATHGGTALARPAAATRSPALSRVVVVAALLVGTGTYLILRNGGWVFDDNTLLVMAHDAGFTWHWLDQPVYQHWDIGMNAVYSLMSHLFPFDYRWALLGMLAVLCLSIVIFERIIGLVIGRGWVSLSLAVWFGLSILWTRQLQWWAAGVQELPTLLCDLLCLYAFLRYQGDHRNRWVALSGGSLAVGLLFYEKPAVMLVYLVLIRVLLMAERPSLTGFLTALRRERWFWLTYCVVLAVWAVGYFSSGAYSGVGAGHVSLGDYLSYFRILWVNTLVPALAGFSVQATHLTTGQEVGIWLLQALVLGLLVWSLVRKPTAWRSWLFLALAVFIDGVIVAHSRVGIFGADIGNDLRYLTDFTWLLPFALCCAFTRGRLLEPRRAGQRGARLRLPRRPVIWLAPALVALYAVAAIQTSIHLEAAWDPSQARHWEANVERGFSSLARRGVYPVVADQPVPFDIVSPAFQPENRFSQVLPLYTRDVQVDGPLSGPLYTVDPEGHVLPASISPQTAPSSALALLMSHRLRISGGTPVVRNGEVCLGSSTSAAIEWTPVRTGGAPGPDYLLLGYSTTTPGASPMLQDAGSGFPSATPDVIAYAPYAHRSIGYLSAGFPRGLELPLGARTGLCLRQLQIVTLNAAGAVPAIS